MSQRNRILSLRGQGGRGLPHSKAGVRRQKNPARSAMDCGSPLPPSPLVSVGLLAHAFSRGFSLVEVTLAIGIVAFGLIAIMGLLPSGLQSFRGSIGRTVGAQVAQGIISEAKQADFASLSNGVTYANFTQEGMPATTAADTIFTAEVTVTNQASVPGTGTTRFINRSIALVRVRVAENPGGAKSGAAAFTGGNTPTFSTYVAKTQ